MKTHKLLVLALIAVACAGQKASPVKTASAQARAAAEAKTQAEQKPQAQTGPATPPPAPAPPTQVSQPSEPSKQTEPSKPAELPPLPQTEPAPKTAAAETKKPVEPLLEPEAQKPPEPPRPVAMPSAGPVQKPAEEPAPTAAVPPKAEEPEGPAPTGPRGGLCVERPADAKSPPSRELLPEMQGAGPKVIALEATGHATIAVQVQFRAGAVDDPPGKAGLTRLAAALVAEGGTESLDAKALRLALYPTAANIGVRVDKELTTFSTRLHRDHVAKVIPLFTDVILHPRFDEKEFGRLRDAALNDVTKRLRQGDDENLGKRALEELMFAGHPYGRLTEGHEADLKSITLAEVKEHARRIFTAARVSIGVAGGYPEGLGADLARALAQLPQDGAPSKAIPAQPPRTLRYRLVEKPGQATAISIGMPWTLSRSDPDFIALSVAQSAFGEHRQFHGRLMQRLREARGLNYGDYAYIEHFEQEGGAASQAQLGRARHQQEFSLWLRPVQNENALFSLRAALYELRRTLADEPFTETEVSRTKEFLQGYLLLFDQTDSRKLGYALDDTALGLHRSPGFLDEWRRKLAQVTAAEVNAAWRRWVDPCQLQIVLVTPDAAATKAALLSGAPTPIHYPTAAERAPELLRADKRVERFSFGTPADAEIDVVPAAKLFE